MKGVVVLALKEMVVEQFGADKWRQALDQAGIEGDPLILPITDVDDQTVMGVINAVCQVLGISLLQAADAFGDYWVNVYTQKVYPTYYQGVETAKDFLLSMDQVHVATTRRIPNAHPPRFEYNWQNDKTLIITYKSHRGLIDILVGCIKGVGKHFKENLNVVKMGSNRVCVTFA